MLRDVSLGEKADLAGFRKAVRVLIGEGVLPEAVVWSAGAPSLFGAESTAEGPPLRLSRAIVELIEGVVCHRDAERYALLYALVFRATRGEAQILEKQHDPLVQRLQSMLKAVRRDLHKMHAFLRFRRIEEAGGERFVAWFEPEHFILEAAAPFFIERFPAMRWSILTPLGSLHWDTSELRVGPPAQRGDAPDSDEFEAGWRGYYESTFNPARANPRAMRREMPQRYWHNMPEAQAIAPLLREAAGRTDAMVTKAPAEPRRRDPVRAVAAMAESAPQRLEELNRLIAASPSFVEGGTRAVLGEGPLRPAIAFVGEQPGDQEDLQGRPFVGPAGRLLDRALAEAGIAREESYLTNAVKHFKHVLRGKKRLHQTPDGGEVKHYRWWLIRELDFVAPRLVVTLGASAALALSGKARSVTRERGPVDFDGRPGFITVHPSYLLRLPESAQAEAYRAFVADLVKAREAAQLRPAAAA